MCVIDLRPSLFPPTQTTTPTSTAPLAPRIGGGGCPTVHRGLSSNAAASAEEAGSSSSRDRYVSPHDWGAIVRDYGKSESSAAAGAKVEIRTIKAEARSLEEQGSRYSRRLRKGRCVDGWIGGID